MNGIKFSMILSEISCFIMSVFWQNYNNILHWKMNYYVDKLNTIYEINIQNSNINTEKIHQFNIDIINIRVFQNEGIYIHTYDGDIHYFVNSNKIYKIGNYIKLFGNQEIMAINNNLELVILSGKNILVQEQCIAINAFTVSGGYYIVKPLMK